MAERGRLGRRRRQPGLRPAPLLVVRHQRSRGCADFCTALTLDGDLQGLQVSTCKLEGDDEELMRQALRLLLSSPQYQMASAAKERT